MATTVRSRIRCNRRAFRVRRRIARVRQSRRSRVHNRDVNRLGVITTAVQHLDHRIEIAGGRCCAGDNAGQGVKSQTCRKRIGENRVTQVRMAATVRSRVRCNRHTLCVCRGVARVRQSRRGRVVYCDVNRFGVISTRVQHLDHRIEVANRCRRTGDDTGQSIQSQARRQCIGKHRVTQVRMAATVRSRVRCNRHTLCVCRGVARVRQSCRGRVVHRDGHVRAVRTTRVTHFDHHIKAA